MTDILIGKNIVKSYPITRGRLSVLKGANIQVRSGEMLAIKGASGVGKSTFLHILGALDKPDSGTVEFDGVNVCTLRDAQRARLRNEKMGFVFQFYHLLGDFDTLENVLFPAKIARRSSGKNKKELIEKGKRVLELVGLGERLRHKPAELSGGEQQRVAIARALMNDPKIIFADEPTGNLDTETSEAIHSVMRDINRKTGQTFVIVTHDENLADSCDRTVKMIDGLITD